MAVGPAGAAAAPPIKIGFTSPLSPPGDYQSGVVNLQTANLTLGQLNAAGGALGRTFALVVGDDQGVPATGAQVVRKLITQDRVSAIVGAWHSSVAIAQAKLATQGKTPFLLHYSWADELTAAHSEYIFRVSPYNSQIAALLVPFLKGKNYKVVAVMAENTDYGIGFAKALTEAAKPAGIRVLTETFPATATDLQAQLLKLSRGSPPPDLLVVSSVYQAGYLIPKQARTLGLKMDILAGWDYPGWSPDWWKITGKAGVGVMYPTFFSKKLKLTDKGETFKQAYSSAYKTAPPIYAYFLHDEIMMVAEVIKQGKSAAPSAVAAGLRAITYSGTTGTIKFERRQGPGPVWNQWLGQQLFVIQYTEEGQKEADADIIYP